WAWWWANSSGYGCRRKSSTRRVPPRRAWSARPTAASIHPRRPDSVEKRNGWQLRGTSRLMRDKMRQNGIICAGAIALITLLGAAGESPDFRTSAQRAQAAGTVDVAVGPQYDTTHVYVAAQDFDRFVASVIATFGGTLAQAGVATVTPTPSSTRMQLVLTPVGTLSVFGFKTPIPYPFGL